MFFYLLFLTVKLFLQLLSIHLSLSFSVFNHSQIFVHVLFISEDTVRLLALCLSYMAYKFLTEQQLLLGLTVQNGCSQGSCYMVLARRAPVQRSCVASIKGLSFCNFSTFIVKQEWAGVTSCQAEKFFAQDLLFEDEAVEMFRLFSGTVCKKNREVGSLIDF